MLHLIHQAGKRPRRGSTRYLVLTPTRKLALQIAASFKDYGPRLRLSLGVVYGGVNRSPQVRASARGLGVLVATPGRLLDLIRQGHLSLCALEIFTLDEADRMLDMGFLPDVKRVLAMIPPKRQTLFFFATMPPAIDKLANGILNHPVRVQVTPPAATVERIEQRVIFADQNEKRALLSRVLSDAATSRVLVFTRTKHSADRVARLLAKGSINAGAIHGNKSHNSRQRALANFRSGTTRVLVATDIASHGTDIQDVTHVINYDLPNEPESYVHHIGRTARAGAAGVAISFCSAAQKGCLRNIEHLITQSVHVQGVGKYGTNRKPAEEQGLPPLLAPKPLGQDSRLASRTGWANQIGDGQACGQIHHSKAPAWASAFTASGMRT